MIEVKRLLSIITLLLGVLPWSAFGAQQRSDNPDVEKLRIQAEERQRQEEEQKDWETRIFTVRYVDLGQLTNALSMFRAKMQSSPELRVLSVRAPKEIMPAIEDAIKRLDVPQPRREAELTIYVIIGSEQPEPSGSIPAILNPVVNQLKGVLAYKGYKLLDTLLTRSSSSNNFNATTLNGILVLSDAAKPSYAFSSSFLIENDGKSPLLRLNNMRFMLQGGGFGSSPGISGNVEIPQGQQVVVGKATLGDKALILVMSAKFD